MTLLVVGSVALDTVETPRGRAEDVLGGAALYALVTFGPVISKMLSSSPRRK